MTVFLKQYGAQRTGTNYLRTLLQKNYPDAVPLMHVLGDKHSAPAPFDALWSEVQRDPDPSLAFVMSATFLRPSVTTLRNDLRQQKEVRRVAEPLAAAYRDGSLGFLISIKDPYAWAVSLAKYEKWRQPGAPVDARHATVLAERCRSFNHRYAEWLELKPSHIVRHEDLIADPSSVLKAIAARFGLAHNGEAFFDETKPTVPVIWDHYPSATMGAAFDRSHYLNERYLAFLSDEAFDAVTATIDWQLMRSYSYSARLPRST